jgi:hypothetical protein
VGDSDRDHVSSVTTSVTSRERKTILRQRVARPFPQQVQRLLVLRPAEREQRADDRRQLLDRRVSLLQVAAQPAGGEAAVPLRLLARDERGQLQRVGEPELRSSCAVASEMTRLPESSARRKTTRGCPCEVAAPPLWGRTTRASLQPRLAEADRRG